MIGLQPNPYTFPLLLAALTSSFLGYLIWRRRPGPGIIPFIIMMICVVEWCTTYLISLIATDFAAKAIFNDLAYIGITIIPPGWLIFALGYTGRERLITRRLLGLLCIEPIAVVILALSNPLHHLFWSEQQLITVQGTLWLQSTPNTLFWIYAVIAYAFIVMGTGLLLQALLRTPNLYRGQLVTLLIGIFTPWLANFLTITRLNPFDPLDITPFAFSFLGVMLAISMTRYHIFDIAPVARERIFAEMRDAALVLDSRNRIVDINLAAIRLIGLKSTNDAVGKMAIEILHDYRNFVEQFGLVEETDTEIVFSTNNQPRYFQLTITPLRNRSGILTGRILMLHEVTELKSAADQITQQNEALLQANAELVVARKEAEEASRLKTEFLATMSHELRTPLNAIIGFTDFMLTGLPGTLNAKQEDYLKRVVSNGERLLALINDILDIAKIEAARLELADVLLSPGELLKNIEGQLRGLAEQKGLRFDTFLDATMPPQLRGDPKRIEQILVNLISNAIRFTASGSVDVRIAPVDSAQWMLSITDTGVGIPPHALDYIFDEFRQVDGSTRREHGGTGLGLAIVRKLAILMGGSVRVQSEVGKGSTFVVQLPIKLPEFPLVQPQP
jgi:PAS domain S-box-containing protein